MAVAIEVRGLVKRYGSLKAVQDLNFQVHKHQVVGLLGPNGSGKSTTMRIICGLTRANAGEVWVKGISVAKQAHLAKRLIGYLPEHNALPEEMRVGEYLRYRAKLKGTPSNKVKSIVEKATQCCDLQQQVLKRRIGTLSKGYRQRVGITDAILADPEILILDEPVVGLDPHQLIAFRKMIGKLKDRMAIVFSSHMLSEVEFCCDQMVVMNHGWIVAQGSSEDLRASFVSAYRYCVTCDAPVAVLNELMGSSDAKRQDINGALSQWHLTLSAPLHDPEIIVDQLVKQGYRVRDFYLIAPTLEDVFLAATCRSWKVLNDEVC